jgi:hypothetical protein
MRRLLTMLAIAALCGPALPAAAQIFGEPANGPVCRRPEVLAVVRRELRRRAVYVEVDYQSVWEEPTGEPDVVRCGVSAATPTYDFPQAGDVPVPARKQHFYDVKVLPAGYVVLGVE